jgi:hypothetical protein
MVIDDFDTQLIITVRSISLGSVMWTEAVNVDHDFVLFLDGISQGVANF